MEQPTITLEERQTLIANNPFFALLKPDDIKALAELMQVHCFAKNDVVVKEGDPVNTLFLIASGRAELTCQFVLENKLAQVPCAVLNPGEAIGLSQHGIFSIKEYHGGSIVALTPLILLEIAVKDFIEFVNHSAAHYPSSQIDHDKNLKFSFIKHIFPFTEMSKRDMQWLEKKLHLIKVPDKQIIFNQGEVAKKCYFIKRGKVEISRADEKQQSRVLAVLTPYAVFGEMALMTTSLRNATATTLENSELIEIDYTALRTALGRSEAMRLLLNETVKKRSIPSPVRQPVVFPHQNVIGDDYIILKNDVEHRYCNLPQLGWFVWQQINGVNTVGDIIKICDKKINSDSREIVFKTLENLAAAHFITFPDIKMRDMSWWQRFKTWLRDKMA